MSIIKHTEQRVAVFIDAQNLYHSARHLFNKRVNFEAVLSEAVAGRKLVRAIAYVITSEAGDEKTFFEALTKQGIEIKTKDLQIFADGSKKADWDVGIAVDAINLSPKLDAVVLVSGDGDFVPMVEYLQHNGGIQVEVVSFLRSSSQKLVEAVDDFIDLAEDPKKFLIGSRRTATQRRSSGRKKSAPRKNDQRKPQDDSNKRKPQGESSKRKPQNNENKRRNTNTKKKAA